MHHRPNEFYDDAIGDLAKCTQLRRLKLENFVLSPVAFTNLVLFCPELRYLKIHRINQAVTQQMAIALLEGLVGVGERKLALKIENTAQAKVWRLKSVMKAMKKPGGLEITLLKQNEERW